MSALPKWLPAIALRPRARGSGPIGVEVAAEEVHLVQMQFDGEVASLRAAMSVRHGSERSALLADPVGLRRLVSRALASKPFKGRQIVSCLAASEVQILPLVYRPSAGQSDAEAIVKEVRDRIGGEIDQSVVDFMPIRHEGADAAERSALVAIAPRARVLAYLAELERAGLEPMALDIRPAALARLVGQMNAATHANVLLINFGRERSYLTVMWGRRLMVDREIEFGESALLNRIGRTLDLDPALAACMLYGAPGDGDAAAAGMPEAMRQEMAHTIAEVLHPPLAALAGEIDRTLIYTASKTRGQSVERVHLQGSVARCAHAVGFLRHALAIPVEVLQPLAPFAGGLGPAALADVAANGNIALAAGMALRRVKPHG